MRKYLVLKKMRIRTVLGILPIVLGVCLGGFAPKIGALPQEKPLEEKLIQTRRWLEENPEAREQIFLWLLTEEQKREYTSLKSEKERRRWEKRYWMERDPTPATTRNERWEEHLRRIAYARRAFPSLTSPWMDDRGRIYIKYGPPDERFVEPTGGAYTWANESWVYHRLQGLVFDFVDKGNGYELVRDLSEAIKIAGGRSSARLLRRLYLERSHLDTKYAQVASALDYIDLTFPGDVTQMPQAEMALERFHALKEKVAEQAPPEYYFPKEWKKPLPFAFSYAQFRGRGDKNRIELYYGVSFEELTFEPGTDGAFHATLKPTIAVFDSLGRPVGIDSAQIDLPVPEKKRIKDRHFVDQVLLHLAPGDYRLAIQMENPEGRRFGAYTTRLEVRPFSRDSLAISDVQFSHALSESPTSGGKYIKYGLKVAPYPYWVVPRNRPIYIYYEIYNLARNQKGETRYRIEHTIQVIKRKRGVLRHLFGGKGREKIGAVIERQGVTPMAVEYFAFDLSQLPLGTMRLTVRVEDLVSGLVAQVEKTFQLVEF